MKLDHRRPEEKMNSVSPWKRKRPEREGSFVIPRHSIGERFDHFVYANMDVDIDTKRAALKASPSVVCLTSLTGGKMFACSGTIIECEDVNGTFISTILTSATLLRSPIDANAIQMIEGNIRHNNTVYKLHNDDDDDDDDDDDIDIGEYNISNQKNIVSSDDLS
ncbi:uncharacterized protein LOC114308931 [Camellia sinensis]|uniref:uncharacterized protein LOC114308931 n=1 Tax=Camellia sinensis TaxID=4442 RepID=UPI001035C93D|nr:uncharacterized protein LOC114308931 [Camellia sinensis]